MISIRNNVFETNSSSCHNLVICKSSLRKALEDYESLYIGDFEYSDDYGMYHNELNENCVINKDAVVKILKDFMKDTFLDEYYLNMQKSLKKYNIDEMSLKDILRLENTEGIEISMILSKHNIDVVRPDIIFGGKCSDTTVIVDKEFLDKDTNEPMSMLLTCIGC